MSRFRKLSQTIWHCQYHIVFVPKYRFRILTGEVAQETEACIRAFVEQQKGELVELNWYWFRRRCRSQTLLAL